MFMCLSAYKIYGHIRGNKRKEIHMKTNTIVSNLF